MEYSVFIFGGTTEARLLVSYLIDQGIKCTVTVTSNYAKELLNPSQLLDVIIKRMDEKEMENAIVKANPSLIVDATHPYAIEVSKNIKKACNSIGKEYLTIIRDIGNLEDTTVFENMDELSTYLDENCAEEDVVLSTLGIKEAGILCKNFSNYKKSVFLRILPSMESLSKAIELGFPSKNIICMQGPFSKAMNVALMNETGAKYLLTKITGKVGGLENKIEAAKQCGVKILALSAPVRENGLSLEDAKSLIVRKVKEVQKNER